MVLKITPQQEKKDYIRQPCPRCTLNHDYRLNGRTITCICGCKIAMVTDKSGRTTLQRVG